MKMKLQTINYKLGRNFGKKLLWVMSAIFISLSLFAPLAPVLAGPIITVTEITQNSVKVSGADILSPGATQIKIKYWKAAAPSITYTTSSITVVPSAVGVFNFNNILLSGLSPETAYSLVVIKATDSSLIVDTAGSFITLATSSTQITPAAQIQDEWYFLDNNGQKVGPFNTLSACENNSGNPTHACVKAYQYLAPLGAERSVVPEERGFLSKYLNIIFKIGIGLAAVLAVVMIVVGGIEYMSSESVSKKDSGKERILTAIGGLILALGAVVLLQTINPDLLRTDILGRCTGDTPQEGCLQAGITVTADDLALATTESTLATNSGYLMAGNFANPQPSPGVANFKTNLQNGYRITEIKVFTGPRTMVFLAKKPSNPDTTVTISSIGIGVNGVSEPGQAVAGDKKTPKGVTYITSDIRRSTSQGQAVSDRTGVYNMGADFFNVGATLNNQNRGIGIHGHYNNGTGGTNGCLALRNDDLVTLAPFMVSGIKVTVQ